MIDSMANKFQHLGILSTYTSFAQRCDSSVGGHEHSTANHRIPFRHLTEGSEMSANHD